MPSTQVARAMRSSFWQRLVSFPAMLASILFVSPFFASLDVQ